MSGLFVGVAGVALSVGLGGIGSVLGIRYAAQAANAAMIEDPSKFSNYLILSALPGTQGIYGFVLGFMLSQKLTMTMSLEQGLIVFFICLPTALACLFSGAHQGKICSSGVLLSLKHPDQAGKAIIFAVFPEFYAIVALVMSLMLNNQLLK